MKEILEIICKILVGLGSLMFLIGIFNLFINEFFWNTIYSIRKLINFKENSLLGKISNKGEICAWWFITTGFLFLSTIAIKIIFVL